LDFSPNLAKPTTGMLGHVFLIPRGARKCRGGERKPGPPTAFESLPPFNLPPAGPRPGRSMAAIGLSPLAGVVGRRNRTHCNKRRRLPGVPLLRMTRLLASSTWVVAFAQQEPTLYKGSMHLEFDRALCGTGSKRRPRSPTTVVGQSICRSRPAILTPADQRRAASSSIPNAALMRFARLFLAVSL